MTKFCALYWITILLVSKVWVTIRPSAPWYNQEVALEKNKRRLLERECRRTKLKCDLERYVLQCSVVNNLISYLKTTYWREFIKERPGDQNVISTSTLNKLLQKEVTKRYPPSPNTTTLANSFADFFTKKIETIHSTLEEKLVNVRPTNLILLDTILNSVTLLWLAKSLNY